MVDSLRADAELIAIRNEFIDESLEGLKSAADDLVQLEHAPNNTALIDHIFRIAHSIKGSAAFFELMTLKTLAHRLEDVLGALRKREIFATRQVVSAALAGLDELSAMLTRVRSGASEVRDDAVIQSVVARLTAALRSEIPIAAPKSEQQPEPSTHEAVEAAGGKTMRVREEAIDSFFRFVGELVIVGEMYDNLQELLAHGADNRALMAGLQRANDSFHVLSRELQKSILDVRKVPIASLLRKAPRVARDVAAATGKEVTVILEGETLLIDKTIAENLDAPLVHMVRNAVDHGIQRPEQREAAGKPRQGNIHVIAAVDGENVTLTVKDDGQGLDYEKLQRKAESLGLVEERRPLGEEAIIALLFHSGVSTADKVTDISGRGVGMDVVKQNIDALGGRIEVVSAKDQGTAFRVLVPETVSTKIISGVGVIVAGDRYILPIENIVRFIQIRPEDVTVFLDRGASIVVDGAVVPVLSLGHILRVTSAECTREVLASGTVVLIEANNKLLGLRVDVVESRRQVVLKNLESIEPETNLFLGGAVMGDGTVSLVLDCEKLSFNS